MRSRNNAALMRARRELEKTPAANHASVFQLEEQVADFLREAKRGDPSPDQIVSAVIDDVARCYFRHAVRTRRGA
jgi:hypothetical protein